MAYLFDLIVIIVALLVIFIFAKRGFLKSIFRFVRWIFAICMAYFFGNKLSTFFYDRFFYGAFLKSMTEKVQALYDGAVGSFNGEAVYEKLPFFLKTEALHNKLIAIEEGDGTVGAIAEVVAKPIATVISNIVGYLLIFIVSFFTCWLVIFFLEKIVKLTALTRAINAILGAAFGAVLACLLVLMTVSVVKFFFAESAVCANSFLVRWLSGTKLLQNRSIFNIGKHWLSGIQ